MLQLVGFSAHHIVWLGHRERLSTRGLRTIRAAITLFVFARNRLQLYK